MRAMFAVAAAGLAVLLRPNIISNRQLNKDRTYAQETAALKSVNTLNTAQVQYNSEFGRFAESLAELGPPITGSANASAADLIGRDLASGEKLGYRFTLTGNPTGYTITAVPNAFRSTGSRTFFSDQSLVVRENYSQEPATVNSPEVGATPPDVSEPRP